jgi:hypothetical protein
LAERKGLHVIEMSPNRNYLPEIVASPIKTPLKEDKDITPIEVCTLIDYCITIFDYFSAWVLMIFMEKDANRLSRTSESLSTSTCLDTNWLSGESIRSEITMM